MVLSKDFNGRDLVEVTLAGVITDNDQADLVSFVRAAIASSGPVRILVMLENYGGWRHDGADDNDGLWLRDDEGVRRLAIVGAPLWRPSVLPMLAMPLRRLPIAYFDSPFAARQWLAREGAWPSSNLIQKQVP